MCDAWVAMSDATLTQNVIMAKNSDRPIFDCQPLVFCPRKRWPAGSKVKLEYIELLQAKVTYATLGSSPYWCWGYEEGINEHSVVVGNEAIFTRVFKEEAKAYREGKALKLGLLGMDLVRLVLERSQTAAAAVELIGRLIERYGQSGSGIPGKDHAEGGYDNSFLIADPNEAWILEAVGRRWVAKRIIQGYSSISNEPTVRTKWDLGSSDIKHYAIKRGWWPEDQKEDFDFARAYIDDEVPRHFSHLRAMRTHQLLGEKDGQITTQWMMRIARDHYEGSFLKGPYFNAADPDFLSICMHVSPADFTWGNTASSCIAILPKSRDELPVFWWTPGPPCNGCYVPFFVHGRKLPKVVSEAGTFGRKVVPPPKAGEDAFAPDSYWWLFRRLMDKVKGNPIKSLPDYYEFRNQVVRAKFDAIEKETEAEVTKVSKKAVELRDAGEERVAHILDEFTDNCVNKVVAILKELLKEFHI